jgi:hypothetical protein
MGGLYDILEAYRLQDPKFTYEGLYQDPPRDDSVLYSGELKTNPYGLMLGAPSDTSSQAFRFSSFPQTYEKSLFNPRIGRPEQSIFYNQPFNMSNVSPMNVNTGIMTAPQATNMFTDDAGLENEYYEEFSEGDKSKKSSGLGSLLRNVIGYLVPGSNLFMGDRSLLQGIRGLNQRLRNTDFGRSKTLAEYFQRREARKDAERLKTVGQQLQQASQEGGGYQPTSREQNVARTESRVSGGRSRAYGL